MRYYRENPDQEISHDWLAGASGYTSSELDQLQAQEPLTEGPQPEELQPTPCLLIPKLPGPGEAEYD